MLLATLNPNDRGIIDIHTKTTYGGGIIPWRKPAHHGLALSEVMNDYTARNNRQNYERAIILATGGFAD